MHHGRLHAHAEARRRRPQGRSRGLIPTHWPFPLNPTITRAAARGCGGIGRRTGFRYQRATVGVRVPPPAPSLPKTSCAYPSGTEFPGKREEASRTISTTSSKGLGQTVKPNRRSKMQTYAAPHETSTNGNLRRRAPATPQQVTRPHAYPPEIFGISTISLSAPISAPSASWKISPSIASAI